MGNEKGYTQREAKAFFVGVLCASMATLAFIVWYAKAPQTFRWWGWLGTWVSLTSAVYKVGATVTLLTTKEGEANGGDFGESNASLVTPSAVG